MANMEFANWLNAQLKARDMEQQDLARRAKMAGYPISPTQISRIVSGTREAGPDACIAIAAGLGTSREEVFRARGWLLREPEQIVEPATDEPLLVELVRKIKGLDPFVRGEVLRGWDILLSLVEEVQAQARDMDLDAIRQIDPDLAARIEVRAERMQQEHEAKSADKDTQGQDEGRAAS